MDNKWPYQMEWIEDLEGVRVCLRKGLVSEVIPIGQINRDAAGACEIVMASGNRYTVNLPFSELYDLLDLQL